MIEIGAIKTINIDANLQSGNSIPIPQKAIYQDCQVLISDQEYRSTAIDINARPPEAKVKAITISDNDPMRIKGGLNKNANGTINAPNEILTALKAISNGLAFASALAA